MAGGYGQVQIAKLAPVPAWIHGIVVPTPEPELGGVQLWEGGPYWAECNVGATKPEEYGYYFWWGDTVGYKRSGGTWRYNYSWNGVTWVSSSGTRMGSSPFDRDACPTTWKRVSELKALGYIDATGNLVAKHDAATAHLGAPWRMPTDAEIAALASNCTTTWTTRNGVYGAYWSSTPHSGGSGHAWCLSFTADLFLRDNECGRYDGQSVRPVRGFAK